MPMRVRHLVRSQSRRGGENLKNKQARIVVFPAKRICPFHRRGGAGWPAQHWNVREAVSEGYENGRVDYRPTAARCWCEDGCKCLTAAGSGKGTECRNKERKDRTGQEQKARSLVESSSKFGLAQVAAPRDREA